MKIELKVNNKLYKGFQSISIVKSMQSIANTFSATLYNGLEIEIQLFNKIQILKDDIVFFTGFIDDYDLSITDTKQPLKIAGRSKAGDLIDCNIQDNKQYQKLNILQIINDLISPFDIKVTSDIQFDSIESFDTKVGETYFNAINRLCKQYNILPISDEFGNLKLIKNSNSLSQTVLKDSDLKTINFKQNATKRFSNYSYRKEAIVTEIEDGKIEDIEVKRFRPFVGVNSDDKTNIDMCNWKRNNDKANSINLDASTDNWDLNINTLVKVETDIINNEFLIKDITYSKDDSGGTMSKITFVDKELYNV